MKAYNQKMALNVLENMFINPHVSEPNMTFPLSFRQEYFCEYGKEDPKEGSRMQVLWPVI